MPPATFDETTVDATAGDYLFRVKGTVPKFAGWMATYGLTPGEDAAAKPDAEGKDGDDDGAVSGVLPPLAEGDRLELKALRPEQKFTQPPPRFSEATLVKELEENGIGRPSTYASIIAVLQDREYVNKIEGRFKPTALGRMITDLLDEELRRHHRRRVHAIARGRSRQDRAGQDRTTSKTLAEFYKKFKKDLARAGKEMIDLKKGIEIGEACDKCGSPMLKRVGKFGPFIACSALSRVHEHPRGRDSSEPESESGEEEIEPCENCGEPMAMKRGRFGQFLACTGYPECKTTRKLIATKQGGLRAAKPDQILDEKCPRCGANLVVKQGRFGEFTACTSYPECKYIKHKTTGVEVPEGRRARAARSSSASRSAARCSSAARTIPTATSCSGTGRSPSLPEMRRAVPRREDHQAARPPAALQQRRVRLLARRRAAETPDVGVTLSGTRAPQYERVSERRGTPREVNT